MADVDVIDRRLRESLAESHLVQFQRHGSAGPTGHGFVVGIGRKWILFHVVDNVIHLNGFQAVRRRDLTLIEREPWPFTERLFALRGTRPTIPAGIDLDRTRDLLRTATDRFRVVALHPRRDRPNEFYVGAVHELGTKSFRLRSLSADANWLRETYEYTYASISRVDFDSGYERALLEVADASET